MTARRGTIKSDPPEIWGQVFTFTSRKPLNQWDHLSFSFKWDLRFSHNPHSLPSGFVSSFSLLLLIDSSNFGLEALPTWYSEYLNVFQRIIFIEPSFTGHASDTVRDKICGEVCIDIIPPKNPIIRVRPSPGHSIYPRRPRGYRKALIRLNCCRYPRSRSEKPYDREKVSDPSIAIMPPSSKRPQRTRREVANNDVVDSSPSRPAKRRKKVRWLSQIPWSIPS